MSREVVFRRVARSEFDEAVAWYEGERIGLGLEFKAAVDQTLVVAAERPELFRPIRGQVRRAVLRRFPYTLHFLGEPEGDQALADVWVQGEISNFSRPASGH